MFCDHYFHDIPKIQHRLLWVCVWVRVSMSIYVNLCHNTSNIMWSEGTEPTDVLSVRRRDTMMNHCDWSVRPLVAYDAFVFFIIRLWDRSLTVNDEARGLMWHFPKCAEQFSSLLIGTVLKMAAVSSGRQLQFAAGTRRVMSLLTGVWAGKLVCVLLFNIYIHTYI